MERARAIAIATAYQDRHGLGTTIDDRVDAVLYASISDVEGPAWVIEAALPPSSFEGSNTITYVVSVREARVEFIVNGSGFQKRPHEGAEPQFDDDELQELRDAGFEVLD